MQLRRQLGIVLLIGALVFAWAGEALVARAQGGPVVRIAYFYRDDCPHCITIIQDVLAPMQEQYGDQLQIKMVQFHDPNQPSGLDPARYEMLLRAEDMLGVPPERRGIPTLVIGGQALIGEEEIRQQLPCLLETCLAEEGTSWPEIPGLEAIPVWGSGSPNPSSNPQPEGGLEELEELEPCGEDEPVCPSGGASIWAAYFYQVGCQECNRVESDIQYLRSRYPQLMVEEFNIYESVDLAKWLAERAGRKEDLHTPALFIGDDALIGEEEITPQNVEALIQKYESTGTRKVWAEFDSQAVQLPEVMTVAVAGLVDGLNPCAFATLIFFISYLTFVGQKGRAVLAVGSAFTLGVFVAYTLVGIGLWRLLSQLPFLTTVGQWVIGFTALLCAVLAGLSFRDYLKARRGRVEDMALVMPHVLRQRAHAVIRRASNVRVFALAAFPVGVVISLLELVCTGQIYLPTIIFVMSVPGLQAQATLFLLLYNLMFILPLTVVFVLVYFGTSSLELGLFLRRHAAAVKLGTALLFAVLAAWLTISIVA